MFKEELRGARPLVGFILCDALTECDGVSPSSWKGAVHGPAISVVVVLRVRAAMRGYEPGPLVWVSSLPAQLVSVVYCTDCSSCCFEADQFFLASPIICKSEFTDSGEL